MMSRISSIFGSKVLRQYAALPLKDIGLGRRAITELRPTSIDGNTKSFDDIPGMKGAFRTVLHILRNRIPIIGKHSKQLRLSDSNMETFQQHGYLFRVDLIYGLQIVFVFHPDDIREVFSREGRYPNRRMLDALNKYRGSKPDLYPSAGLLVENGKKWHDVRSKVQQPMLRPQIVHTYIPSMDLVSQEFVSRMADLRGSDGEIPNFLNELYKWALESIGVVAFNARLGCLGKDLAPDSEPQVMIDAVNMSFDASNDTEFGLQLWRLFPTKSYRRIVAAQEIIRKVSEKYFNQTLERIRSRPPDAPVGGSLLEKLATREDLDHKETLTFIMDLLAAGIDTTSHSMAFTLYLLAKNPDKQEKLHREVSEALATRDTPITAEIINELRYLRSCVKESMRMMSVVDGTARKLDQDITLRGYRVPAGVYFMLLSQTTSMLEENFPNARQYIPERWSPGSEKPHPFANLPFGHGSRSCIGRRFAMQEIHLLLAKIVKNFKVEYHHEDIGLMTRFVNMPDKPLRFSFVSRE